jgi:hypothetical protein
MAQFIINENLYYFHKDGLIFLITGSKPVPARPIWLPVLTPIYTLLVFKDKTIKFIFYISTASL